MKNREMYPELKEIIQSKSLKNHIQHRLYTLRMNYFLQEEDVINYVVVSLIETLQSQKYIQYPVAWAKSVSNRFITHQYIKLKKSDVIDFDKVEHLVGCRINHISNLEEEEEEENIHKTIKKLKKSEQSLLIWRFFNNLSWEQIATKLSEEEKREIKVATARKRGERAMNELRKRYLQATNFN
jgi:RNA polymerase sigma factor (sigma-70 family)